MQSTFAEIVVCLTTPRWSQESVGQLDSRFKSDVVGLEDEGDNSGYTTHVESYDAWGMQLASRGEIEDFPCPPPSEHIHIYKYIYIYMYIYIYILDTELT
jgi:hypothetical protein